MTGGAADLAASRARESAGRGCGQGRCSGDGNRGRPREVGIPHANTPWALITRNVGHSGAIPWDADPIRAGVLGTTWGNDGRGGDRMRRGGSRPGDSRDASERWDRPCHALASASQTPIWIGSRDRLLANGTPAWSNGAFLGGFGRPGGDRGGEDALARRAAFTLSGKNDRANRSDGAGGGDARIIQARFLDGLGDFRWRELRNGRSDWYAFAAGTLVSG
ncbi:hypothetical protein CC2G_003519 [Coprinopsis cinerea AmutBmut pab1-1]|nr:hypothetical protein CC2G_003519 [Coprinopsis cinerea AmutBmut pab1-1]